MVTIHIKLDSIAKVKDFNRACCRQEFDIDIISDRYVIDAKSIMGIFSLDLTKTLTLKCNCSEQEAKEFINSMGEYIIND